MRQFDVRMSNTDRMGWPREKSLIPARIMPSWKISRASVDMLPGTIPPTSFQ